MKKYIKILILIVLIINLYSQIYGNESEYSKKFVRIPAGQFRMGDNWGWGMDEYDDRPLRNIKLSEFYLSKHEVTFDEFAVYCKSSKVQIPKDSGFGKGKKPVINVSWIDAVKYCNWLSKKHGLKPCYDLATYICDFSKNGYRLPTEAEWEYAYTKAFFKFKTRFPWGNDFPISPWTSPEGNRKVNYYFIVGKTMDVGSFKGYNELYDMSGNVSEWCYDRYERDIYKVDYYKLHENPTGSINVELKSRVHRGGNFRSTDLEITGVKRAYELQNRKQNYIGFRIAKSKM